MSLWCERWYIQESGSYKLLWVAKRKFYMAKVVKVKPSQSFCCNGCVESRQRNMFNAFEWASGSRTSILILIGLDKLFFGTRQGIWCLFDKSKRWHFHVLCCESVFFKQLLSSMQQHKNSEFTILNQGKKKKIQCWGRTLTSLSHFLGSELGNELWYHLYNCH